ncbi:MAG TPA: TlpA disulfide reductase family protein [Gemmatimonadaceae bacterium]|nr:TlpA disulfide reductase family protein [Gemmatimonadaceae bacterium]
MTRRAQWIIVACVVLALAGGASAATYAMRDQFFLVSVGSRAPNFAAATLGPGSESKGIADYRGDVVLLNIWATWCGPCRIEMPEIQALYSNFGPAGFRVVAVSIDNPGMEQAIRGFVRDYGLTFEVLHDPSGDIQRSYQTSGVPETFIIGRDGVIRKKMTGAVRWNSGANQALVRQLLAEPRPA